MAGELGFEPVETGSYYFISYDSGDCERVSEYALKMHLDGLPLWYDKGIHAGTNWEEVIAKRIEGCKGVILFLSKSPFKKDKSFVRTEFKIAVGYEKQILIVYLDRISNADVSEREEYTKWYEQLRQEKSIPACEWQDVERCKRAIYKAIGFDRKLSPRDVFGFEPVDKDGYYYVNYEAGDDNRVAKYVKSMNADGFPMWYDKGVHAGATWEAAIAEHIEHCEGMVLFLSKRSFEKERSLVRTEFNIASCCKKRIVVVLLDKISLSNIPERYKIWYVDLCDNPSVLAYDGKDVDRCKREIYVALRSGKATL